MPEAVNPTSTRPYLIRALYEWCSDNGFTPYIAVRVDRSVQVPREYVKDGEIVLNISFDATSGLKLGNDYVEFSARFAGTARDIVVPVDHVTAIYARENGQGMAFPAPAMVGDDEPSNPDREAGPMPEGGSGLPGDGSPGQGDPPPSSGRGRPNLTRVK